MTTSQKVVNNPLGNYAVIVDRTSDAADRQAVGLDFGAVSGGVLTPSRVSATNPLPVTAIPSGSSVLTPAPPTFSTVGASSAQAVAANASRRGLVLINTSNNRISLGLAATAVLDRGITLYPQGVFWMDSYMFTTGAVNAIASAASSNLTVQEFT